MFKLNWLIILALLKERHIFVSNYEGICENLNCSFEEGSIIVHWGLIKEHFSLQEMPRKEGIFSFLAIKALSPPPL